MIIDICVDSANHNPLFVGYKKRATSKEKICEYYDSSKGNEQIVLCNILHGENEKLYYSLFSDKAKELSKDIPKHKRINAYFILDENEVCIGKMIVKTNKLRGRLLASYYSVIFQYKNRKYECFEIGFGREGQYYVIYEQDKIIAIVESKYASSYEEPIYTIYSLDERYEFLHMASYWYFTREYGADNSSKALSLVTPQKEMREKYDPMFIQKIIKMEGVL